ncbi:MAG TPA: type II secretion system F family protein [Frankiaceae bacterium]|nr:type II secretion system F family protein [Frankiaceae bacterium]
MRYATGPVGRPFGAPRPRVGAEAGVLTVLAAASAALAVQPFGRPPPSGGRARVARRQVSRPALAVGGLLVLAAVAGPVGAVVGAVGLALLTRARRRSAADRQARLRRGGAAELLRALAAELESGLDPPSAVAAAAATADQRLRPLLDPVLLAAAHGGDVADALVRTGVPRLRELAACWLTCRASGAALAPVVDRLAWVAEGDEAHHAEIRAALAGPRASGRLLAGLPLAGLVCPHSSAARRWSSCCTPGRGPPAWSSGSVWTWPGWPGWSDWRRGRPDDAAPRRRGRPPCRRLTHRSDEPPGTIPQTPPPGRDVLVACGHAGREHLATTRSTADRSAGRRRVRRSGGRPRRGVRARRRRGYRRRECRRRECRRRGCRGRRDRRHRRRPGRRAPARRRDACPCLGRPAARPRSRGGVPGGGRPVGAGARGRGEAVGGPLGDELAVVAYALRLGGAPAQACARWRLPGAPPTLAAAARAFGRADESGSRLAGQLLALADRERATAHARALETARQVGTAAVAPLGVCFLPAFVVLGIVPVVVGAARHVLP